VYVYVEYAVPDA